MTLFCNHCVSEVEQGAVVCVQCGTAQNHPGDSDRSFDIPTKPSYSLAAFNQLRSSLLEEPMPDVDSHLNGIGGWLIWIAINLAIAPVFLARHLLTVHLPSIAGGEYEGYLSTHHASAVLIAFETISDSVFLLMVLVLNFLFYRKLKGFPPAMVLYLVIHLAYIAINHFSVVALHPEMNHSKDTGTLIGTVIGAAVWIPYFIVSRRVKATFVRGGPKDECPRPQS